MSDILLMDWEVDRAELWVETSYKDGRHIITSGKFDSHSLVVPGTRLVIELTDAGSLTFARERIEKLSLLVRIWRWIFR